ncbi:MAG: hypothetical protein ACSHXD_00925 [Marinosulfonomonas sp.]
MGDDIALFVSVFATIDKIWLIFNGLKETRICDSQKVRNGGSWISSHFAQSSSPNPTFPFVNHLAKTRSTIELARSVTFSATFRRPISRISGKKPLRPA